MKTFFCPPVFFCILARYSRRHSAQGLDMERIRWAVNPVKLSMLLRLLQYVARPLVVRHAKVKICLLNVIRWNKPGFGWKKSGLNVGLQQPSGELIPIYVHGSLFHFPIGHSKRPTFAFILRKHPHNLQISNPTRLVI